jgi:hypothetical protein
MMNEEEGRCLWMEYSDRMDEESAGLEQTCDGGGSTAVDAGLQLRVRTVEQTIRPRFNRRDELEG